MRLLFRMAMPPPPKKEPGRKYRPGVRVATKSGRAVALFVYRWGSVGGRSVASLQTAGQIARPGVGHVPHHAAQGYPRVFAAMERNSFRLCGSLRNSDEGTLAVVSPYRL